MATATVIILCKWEREEQIQVRKCESCGIIQHKDI